MPEPKSRFLNRILEDKTEESKPFTSERQSTAQSFNLHVERRDGRRAEGFAWSHYAGYRWTDEGDHERLVVIFGARAVEIEGHNLGALVSGIREGQLNGIYEMVTQKRMLLEASNPGNEPIISSVKTYPDFDEVLKELKGDAEQHTGFAGQVRR